MTTEENKALVRRYFEAVDQGEADLIDAMFAADCIFHRGDLVACRLQHNAVLRGEFTSRIGTFDVAGKPIEWSANVFFRFENGLIKEEWIARDELGILLGLGIVPEIDTNKL
jgi:predicted ester cyclase